MSEFYRTKEFRKLSNEWQERLRENGFKDQEDVAGNLKNHDKRTLGFQNQERIRDLFISIDHFMTVYPEMPKFERRVMELYSQGLFINAITKRVKASDKNVRNVIKRYKALILAVNRFLLNADFPLSLRGSDIGPRGCGSSDPFKI